MARLEGEAIVLRAVEYGESDLIAHLLMPEWGRVTVIAKHARKSHRRFPGSLDLFNHVRVSVSPRRSGALGFLEQAVLLSPFLSLRARAPSYALASYLVEWMDRMAPERGAHSDMKRIFDFTLSALDFLCARSPNLALRLFLELRGFEALGLRPELARCVRCGTEASSSRLGFHVADGGVVCATHAAGAGQGGVLPVHLGTLRILEKSLACELSQLDRLAMGKEALAEAEQVLFRFQRFHLGFELRSERFLRMTLAGGAA
jgi:DNA repair protein RecO (recombination protein O)